MRIEGRGGAGFWSPPTQTRETCIEPFPHPPPLPHTHAHTHLDGRLDGLHLHRIRLPHAQLLFFILFILFIYLKKNIVVVCRVMVGLVSIQFTSFRSARSRKTQTTTQKPTTTKTTKFSKTITQLHTPHTHVHARTPAPSPH
jgi:hypothetical protein